MRKTNARRNRTGRVQGEAGRGSPTRVSFLEAGKNGGRKTMNEEEADHHKREARRKADGMQQVQAAPETYHDAKARYCSQGNGCIRQTA